MNRLIILQRHTILADEPRLKWGLSAGVKRSWQRSSLYNVDALSVAPVHDAVYTKRWQRA